MGKYVMTLQNWIRAEIGMQGRDEDKLWAGKKKVGWEGTRIRCVTR